MGSQVLSKKKERRKDKCRRFHWFSGVCNCMRGMHFQYCTLIKQERENCEPKFAKFCSSLKYKKSVTAPPPHMYTHNRVECGFFFIGETTSSNQRLGIILEVQIKSFGARRRTRVKVFLFKKFQGA